MHVATSSKVEDMSGKGAAAAAAGKGERGIDRGDSKQWGWSGAAWGEVGGIEVENQIESNQIESNESMQICVRSIIGQRKANTAM